MALALAGGALGAGPARPAFAASLRQATPVATAPGDQAEAIVALARDVMSKQDVNAVILRVTIDGQEVVTAALGESMTGVPATTEMHFRNGAVAFFYVSTLLLRLVDQQLVSLDDSLASWLPDLPDADQVTLRMLANMTAGYPDFVQNPKLSQELYADPFRQWTPEELIALGLSTPRVFAPGTNWDYSHTDYVILGQALEKITASRWTSPCRSRSLAPWAYATPSPGRRRRSRSRSSMPSARSGGKRWASPLAHHSSRSRPTGTPPGRLPQARSRRVTSLT
jgi:CubicO group peptidase (beta-lactamase class C family)